MVLVFILATIASYLAIAFGWFAYAEHAQVADREGGVGMGVIFIIAPAAAVCVGTATTLVFGGPKAAPHIKVAAAIIGLLILAAVLMTLIGL